MQKKDKNKFKNKNQPELPEIKLYGSPTTKKLKKKHSSRLVGRAEMGSQGQEDMQQGDGARWARLWLADGAAPFSHVDNL